MSTTNRDSYVASPSDDQQTSQQGVADESSAQQLVTAVDELLDQLQNRFENVSTEILGKLDDMSRRIDELENSIASARDSTHSA
ncbi:hypothetical protein TMEN_3222 [Trichophyton mentagrophytes]|uniref:Heat shock factor-binding protein 1 n=3 Tax=Trichophyton TaxID=5550 RepID=A0A9P5CWJ3_9EURO|nr:hypothetical protein TEQG_07233 [Trichophyton equinum CBS 127.97]EZF33159.1 hypothetical protein H101_03258 [Trichophyton interdigitale H6]KAF3896574.1 Heat shock factor-binding protein 1 [Trichophyton interdigitale]KDB25790.1 hypothetical protein H109_02419 [Trichophyton interdigitale MR816]GBF60767.1 hypothetical protein TMEN_3222 [Trichophyton mentagrophytes]